MDLVQLSIKGISYSQMQSGAYALILQEDNSKLKLPIVIGSFEAQSIALALEKEIKSPRPLTHDLIVEMTRAFHIQVVNIVIHSLKDGVFFSNIVCQNRVSKEITHIDSRTSDAIAIAVRLDIPIFCSKKVISEAGVNLELDVSDSEQDHSDLDEVISEIELELETVDELEEDDFLEKEEIFQYKTIDELQQAMSQALESEDYETAAKIRDEIDRRKEP